MGLRGPAPQPTALKIKRGNPGKRSLNKNEPKPHGTPKCPSWLDTEAKDEWKVVAPELKRLGLLSIVDGAALAAYCQNYSRWKQAEKKIQTDGMWIENRFGDVVAHPAIRVAEKAMDLIKRFVAEFGFTPSSRCRLTANPEQPTGEEDKEKRLFG